MTRRRPLALTLGTVFGLSLLVLIWAGLSVLLVVGIGVGPCSP